MFSEIIKKINYFRNLFRDYLIFLSRASHSDFLYSIRNPMKICVHPGRLRRNTGILYLRDSSLRESHVRRHLQLAPVADRYCDMYYMDCLFSGVRATMVHRAYRHIHRLMRILPLDRPADAFRAATDSGKHLPPPAFPIHAGFRVGQ